MTKSKNFITEEVIEKLLVEMEVEGSKVEQHLKKFEEEQGAIYNWLISDSFDILTTEERGHLLYMAVVIWRATSTIEKEYHQVTPEEIEKQEEEVWTIFLDSKGKFRDKLDVFFKDYDQEDLLAFVEDALEVDEEDFLTPVGREIMFVIMKVLIDLLTDQIAK